MSSPFADSATTALLAEAKLLEPDFSSFSKPHGRDRLIMQAPARIGCLRALKKHYVELARAEQDETTRQLYLMMQNCAHVLADLELKYIILTRPDLSNLELRQNGWIVVRGEAVAAAQAA